MCTIQNRKLSAAVNILTISSDMKSTLKSILKDRIFLLCILDILSIFCIIWNEGRIQYEPLLYNSAIIYPLDPTTYNTIIVTIVVNIIVLIDEIRRPCRNTSENNNLKVIVPYFFFVICCLAWGYLHIISRDKSGVINKCNGLFWFLIIKIFGEKALTSVITVTNLYISLCVMHIISCIILMSRSRRLSKRESSGE